MKDRFEVWNGESQGNLEIFYYKYQKPALKKLEQLKKQGYSNAKISYLLD